MSPDTSDKLADHAERAEKHRRWSYARRPKRVGDVLAQVMAKRGYAAGQADEQLQDAWAKAAGEPFASQTRPVGVRRGKLEVLVTSSPMMQEIQFHRTRLLEAIQRALPDAQITALKLRVGRV